MSMTALTVSKMWKKSKCPDILINKMWHIHTMGYYSALKWNKILYVPQHGWSLKMLCLVQYPETGQMFMIPLK